MNKKEMIRAINKLEEQIKMLCKCEDCTVDTGKTHSALKWSVGSFYAYRKTCNCCGKITYVDAKECAIEQAKKTLEVNGYEIKD